MTKDADWGSSRKNASSNRLTTAGDTIFRNTDEPHILPERHPKHTSSSTGKYINKIPEESIISRSTKASNYRVYKPSKHNLESQLCKNVLIHSGFEKQTQTVPKFFNGLSRDNIN